MSHNNERENSCQLDIALKPCYVSLERMPASMCLAGDGYFVSDIDIKDEPLWDDDLNELRAGLRVHKIKVEPADEHSELNNDALLFCPLPRGESIDELGQPESLTAAETSDQHFNETPNVPGTPKCLSNVTGTRKSLSTVSKTRKSTPKGAETQKYVPKVSRTSKSMTNASRAQETIPKVSETRKTPLKVSETRKSVPNVSRTSKSLSNVSRNRKSPPKVSETHKSLQKVSDSCTRTRVTSDSDPEKKAPPIKLVRGDNATRPWKIADPKNRATTRKRTATSSKHPDDSESSVSTRKRLKTHKDSDKATPSRNLTLAARKNLPSEKRPKKTKKTPFKCKVCKSYFATPQTLAVHVRIHSSIRQFRCDKCEKSFSRSDHLNLHRMVHYKSKRLYRFACDQCPMKFYRSERLTSHLRTHTGEKIFPCKVCGIKLATRYSQMVHARIHDSVKPFSCTRCKKKFRTSTHLKTHETIHSKARPFKCDRCGKGFGRWDHLKLHKRSLKCATSC